MIRLEDISVEFEGEGGAVLALKDIDLEIRSGEFMCIMGPSGCGKTTLLNVIAGFVHPTSGTVRIGDRLITKAGPDRAVVFQEDAVFPWMTVEENIGFSLTVRGRPKDEVNRAVDWYTQLVHLSDFRKSWPKELSGGMKKRVDLARAYAADPEVLLLDEPFGTLDIMTKEYLQGELVSLWQADPRTVVFITHDVEEALFLGQRVGLMTPRPGRIAHVYEPRFPSERRPDLKLTEEFVDARRSIRQDMESLGIVAG